MQPNEAAAAHVRHEIEPAAAVRTGLRLTSIALVAYLILKPFYLLPSGYPQIADVVLALACLLTIWAWPAALRGSAAGAVALFGMFCIYVCVINSGWSLFLGDRSVVTYALYYAFNFALMVLVVSSGENDRDRTFRAILVGVCLGSVVQLLILLGGDRTSVFREIGTFNNPNQLGYWALLSLSIFFVCARRVRVRPIVELAMVAILCYAGAVALSKAAMVAMVLLLLIHFAGRPRMLLVLGAVGVLMIVLLGEARFIENVQTRIANIGMQRDDNIAGRGYARIFDHPEYLPLGAGEGAIYRFPDEDLELHSTFGTVLFSYGIPGFLLFLWALFRSFRQSGWRLSSYLVPSLLYGVAHQGLRFSLFWMLLAVVVLAGSGRRSA